MGSTCCGQAVGFIRGQGFALMSTGLMTLQGVGPMVIGGLAETIPIGMAIAAAGIGTLVIAGWLSASPTFTTE